MTDTLPDATADSRIYMPKLNSILVMEPASVQAVYADPELERIGAMTHLAWPPQTRESIARHPELLADVDLLFSGWGGPVLDSEFLAAAPRLRAVFYAAGAMGSMLTPAVWERNLTVTSALAANAIPVAEFTLASILLSLKHVWRLVCEVRHQKRFPNRDAAPGAYGTKVGLVSLGAVGTRVVELLQHFDLDILVYDPFLEPDRAAALGVTTCPLDEIFTTSDVVSLHTPSLPETRSLIRGWHFASMKPHATFINTARPTVVHQDEMIDVAIRRPDLQFILDVVEPEPPAADSLLYTLPNIMLTPHVAGSVGLERQRMGRFIVDELERYLGGQPLRGQVTPQIARHSSHRPLGLTPEALEMLGNGTLAASKAGQGVVRTTVPAAPASVTDVPVASEARHSRL